MRVKAPGCGGCRLLWDEQAPGGTCRQEHDGPWQCGRRLDWECPRCGRWWCTRGPGPIEAYGDAPVSGETHCFGCGTGLW